MLLFLSKRIYICVNRKELDQVYQRICHLTKQVCLCCGHEDCHICNKFKFIYKQYMQYIDKPKIMLWKIYLKTNEYDYISFFLHLCNFLYLSVPSVSIFSLLITQFVPFKKITNSVKL